MLKVLAVLGSVNGILDFRDSRTSYPLGYLKPLRPLQSGQGVAPQCVDALWFR